MGSMGKLILGICLLLTQVGYTAEETTQTLHYNLDTIYDDSITALSLVHLSTTQITADYVVQKLDNYADALDPDRILLTQEDVKLYQEKLKESGVFLERVIAEEMYQLSILKMSEWVQWAKTTDLKKNYKNWESFDATTPDRATNKEELLKNREQYLANEYAQLQARTNKPVQSLLQRRIDRKNEILISKTPVERLQIFINTMAQSLDANSYYQLPHNFLAEAKYFAGLGIEVLTTAEGIQIKKIHEESDLSKHPELVDSIITDIQFHENDSWYSINEIGSELFFELSRGQIGSSIGIKVKKENQEQTLQVQRRYLGKIQSTYKNTSERVELTYYTDTKTQKKVAVVHIPQFYAPTEEELIAEEDAYFDEHPESQIAPESKLTRTSLDFINTMKQISKDKQAGNILDTVVIDMRGNLGGDLKEAQAIAYYLMGKVTTFQERNNREITQKYSAPFGEKEENAVTNTTSPISVLVNTRCASACELLSSTLKDHNRAIIIGSEKTFGKGVGQSVKPIINSILIGPDGEQNAYFLGSIEVTSFQFYNLDGISIQATGLNPHVHVMNVYDKNPNHGMSALKNHIPNGEPIDIIQRTSFDKINSPLSKRLQTQTEARWQSSKYMDYVQFAQQVVVKKANQKNKINIPYIKSQITESIEDQKEIDRLYSIATNEIQRFLAEDTIDLEIQELLAVSVDYDALLNTL